jgi:signal peptidase I
MGTQTVQRDETLAGRPRRAGYRSVQREYYEALLIAAIFLQFANTFVVQTYYIPSGSMKNTLLVGDHLFVNRFIYGPAPTELERKLLPLRPVRRGDIVVFRSKENLRDDVVKRCVGLPGDVIQVINKQLYINSKAVNDSSYAIHTDFETYPPHYQVRPQLQSRDFFGPFTVPPNSYFCMGDNRDNSWDSRFWLELPSHYLLGRAFAIYWSKNSDEMFEAAPRDVGPQIGDFAHTALHFFTITRWDRTFRVVR